MQKQNDVELGKILVEQLKATGILDQNRQLLADLEVVSNRLEEYAKTAVSRLRETESIAAHVLAIEALLVVILRQMPISKADLISEVKKLQPKGNSNGQQTSLVESIASDIFEKSNNF